MSHRRAVRETGPATVADDTPTRDELIEAIVNLRAKSDADYAAWTHARDLGRSKELYDRTFAQWSRTHRHLDNMCEGVEMLDFDAQLAE